MIEELEYFVADGEYYPEAPVVEGYTFVGWDTDITKLPTDVDLITIKAIYNKNEISIKFLGLSDVVIKEYNLKSLDELETVVVPEIPEVTGYDISGWDKEYVSVWEDQTYTAIYLIKKFTVKFIGLNDVVISEEKVTYNGNATLPEAPVVEGFEFKGYSSDGKNVTSDLVITLNYEVKKFTVKFVDVNDEVISEVEVEYGKDVTLPNAPTLEGYEFKDFSHDGKNITEDITIKLNYEKVNSSNPVTSDCKTGSLIKLMFTLFATFTFAYIFKKH